MGWASAFRPLGYSAATGVASPRRLARFEQRVDQRFERDAGIDVVAEAHFAVEGVHRGAHVDLLLRDAEVGVAQDDAEHEQAVGALDDAAHARFARQAQIGTGERGVGLGQDAAPHEAGDRGDGELLRQPGDLLFQPVAAHLDPEQQRRAARGGEAREDFVRGRAGGPAVDRRGRVGGHLADLRVDHVARQLEVDRARLAARLAQHARDLARRARRVVEHGLGAGHFAHDQELAVQALDLVVQPEAHAPFGRAGSARDHRHGRLLGVGGGDRVDHVERTRAVGDRGDAERAAVARRGVGGEADRRLVAERVQRQDARALDFAEERQREVARDAEDFSGAVVLECGEQGVCELHCAGGRCRDDGRYPNQKTAQAALSTVVVRLTPENRGISWQSRGDFTLSRRCACCCGETRYTLGQRSRLRREGGS